MLALANVPGRKTFLGTTLSIFLFPLPKRASSSFFPWPFLHAVPASETTARTTRLPGNARPRHYLDGIGTRQRGADLVALHRRQIRTGISVLTDTRLHHSVSPHF